MTHNMRDIVLSLVLLILATVWTYIVIDTIRPGFGHGDIGPRAFPMVLGFILAGLSVLLLLRALPLRQMPPSTHCNDGGATGVEVEPASGRWGSVVLVSIEIAGYGFLLQKIGFVLATPVLLLFVLVVHLRLKSWKTILGTTLGITLGCWLIFKKILGIYLANGTWFNIG
jgi:putative tricarboxylic transport membrane protein